MNSNTKTLSKLLRFTLAICVISLSFLCIQEMPVHAQSGTQTLLANSMTTQTGDTGSGHSVSNLHVNDQSGTQDDWDNYVEFASQSAGTTYQGYRSYTLPSNIPISSVLSLQVKANYRGPASAGQVWAWSLFDWSSGTWVSIGDNTNAPWWLSWYMLMFDAPANAPDFINSTTREIRVRLTSNNMTDNMLLDYEAVLVSYDQPNATITYQPTTALFQNPERGFYRYFKSVSRLNAPNSRQTWSVPELTNTNTISWLSAAEEATITQVYCYFLLDEFLTSPIDGDFLTLIRANLDNVRAAGKKCILRFSYSEPTDNDTDPEYAMRSSYIKLLEHDIADATLSQTLSHIQQIEPILDDYVDIISVLQAGFIGVWGEWYYTDHFADAYWDYAAEEFVIQDWRFVDRRKVVVDALLAALPEERMIAVRYPKAKVGMYNFDQASDRITAAEAYQNTPKARIGYHNDAFLNTYGDSGTYWDSSDRPYMEAETVYLTMGGEVNEPDDTEGLSGDEAARPRTCESAVNEMALYHWSYINTNYYTNTLTDWQNNGCIHDPTDIAGSILDQLGYRLRLTQATLPSVAEQGSTVQILIDLVNEGFAAPYNPRDVFLVLKETTTAYKTSFALSVDPREWLADGQTYSVNQTINLPANLPVGEYELYLHLPDPTVSLADDARYAIRLANAGMWTNNNSWDGYNSLQHSMSVNSASGSPTVRPTQLQPSGSISQSNPQFSWLPVSGNVGEYRIVIYDVGNSTIVGDSTFAANSVCVAASCAATFTSLSLSSGSFTWLIRAQNASGNGPWSIYP